MSKTRRIYNPVTDEIFEGFTNKTQKTIERMAHQYGGHIVYTEREYRRQREQIEQKQKRGKK